MSNDVPRHKDMGSWGYCLEVTPTALKFLLLCLLNLPRRFAAEKEQFRGRTFKGSETTEFFCKLLRDGAGSQHVFNGLKLKVTLLLHFTTHIRRRSSIGFSDWEISAARHSFFQELVLPLNTLKIQYGGRVLASQRLLWNQQDWELRYSEFGDICLKICYAEGGSDTDVFVPVQLHLLWPGSTRELSTCSKVPRPCTLHSPGNRE